MNAFNQAMGKVGVVGVTVFGSLAALNTAAVAEMFSPQQAGAIPSELSVKSSCSKSSAEIRTIAEIASSSESFETLTAALEAADLVTLLNGSDAYTVFAPTDEAFAALPDGTLEMLLKPENRDQLVQILTYHVVPGQVLSTDLSEGNVASAEGRPLAINLDPQGVFINGATVLQADIVASNGVIHVIDTVLLPPTE